MTNETLAAVVRDEVYGPREAHIHIDGDVVTALVGEDSGDITARIDADADFARRLGRALIRAADAVDDAIPTVDEMLGDDVDLVEHTARTRDRI